jgi:hypothetical protein
MTRIEGINADFSFYNFLHLCANFLGNDFLFGNKKYNSEREMNGASQPKPDRIDLLRPKSINKE